MAEPTGRRLAVLGSPVSHSRSPALHVAAYRALGLDWSYGPHDVAESELEAFLAGLGPEWRGLSLTMPLKGEAARLASSLDHTAALTGAVNTLLLHDGRRGATARETQGFNTDVGGIVRAVRAAGVDGVHTVVVLGSGATAASALVAAAELGAERIVMAARRPERGAALSGLASACGVFLEVRSLAASLDDVDSSLVIATLPGGANTALGPHALLASRSLLLDVAYDPWPSVLADDWVSEGGRVLSGLAMLVHQALLQVRVFVNGDPQAVLPKEDAVLAAMLGAVGLSEDGTRV